MNQTTIKESCLLPGGIGLHSGKKVDVTFHPAPPNSGIIFHRTDKSVKIPANWRYAEASALCTTIGIGDVKLGTIEHLLSACNGLGIDNLEVELTGEEVPIYDGSGIAFVEKFKQIGLKELDATKKMIRITKPVSFTQGDISIMATPSQDSQFNFSIDFDHDQVRAQEFQFTLTAAAYHEQIAAAKTFCREEDIPKMQEAGLIKGASEDIAVILDSQGGFKNMGVMTWLNEPNLHKILDQIGDFYLADNMRILGNIFSHKSGHASHFAFISHLMNERQDAFEVVPVP
ncbi:MAG: UDP-3-O-acyl-N-acetylglucosamine deacetylase [SAR324 cluster bacterium]|nr:UDP-3-O-acyl-N-acetylglucosamine deacetylase [SAR324 cluster bacterium]